ncbi:hypothetical protein HGB07_08560, partial [Candidatus Roizmanbacteria bacterium]|nr:hypothetical protein [Candidatus Roizmanbacteria bacterium]
MNSKTIRSSDIDEARRLASRLYIPGPSTHKGQNGKILIVGGSQLFHAAILWSAETASHFVDMVHFASTEENNEIFLSLKKIFRNGIIVPRTNIDLYAKEDDVILIGP